MRQSGILMHITSLPGPYGIGTMGKEAFRFMDFLQEAGQSVWQLLPLNPTGYGDSPYQSCSSFAGNPYLIDLDTLVEEDLLQQEELDGVCWFDTETRVDFGKQYNEKWKILRLAYGRFTGGSEFDRFCLENGSWLTDYALFMALKNRNGGAAWYQWEETLKRRDPEAIWQVRHDLAEEIRFHSFVQFIFDKQWRSLRAYAKEKAITIIGDVPIYVPLDSVEVWTAPELFQLDEALTPTAVAGCPPDAFSEDGQLWGNPLYRWDVMAKDGFTWWIRRLRAAGKLFDTVRLDHFRGYEAYWAVPYGDTTARNGKWMPGGGLAFMEALQKALPELDLIAEDLGFLTPEVLELRDKTGLPGMKILQFGFGSPEEVGEYRPHNLIPNSVVYIGTHDNPTALEWFDTWGKESLAYAKEYMALTEAEGLVWGMIRTALGTVSDLCIFQLQDILELGAEARMNNPGIVSNVNWTWRAEAGKTTPKLAKKLRKMTYYYGRCTKGK